MHGKAYANPVTDGCWLLFTLHVCMGACFISQKGSFLKDFQVKSRVNTYDAGERESERVRGEMK